MSEQELIIELDQQPIELYKLLKIADLVSGGGEAKVVISEGYVFLNGEVEYQKRKKVYHQDIIEFNGNVLHIEVNENLSLAQEESDEQTDVEVASKDEHNISPSKKQKQNEATRIEKNTSASELKSTSGGRKRRPISF
ncbi:RNA-binding S4 domain-containing protein [Colwellia sp. RSH04]|uniref:RNA-binding S4 domain-containing protein n=1 Tax=Colwellia sp. RSH04 TaxID=2305464 RepID=UPI000E59262A|nr:RNA-binding S4 domain-containing protein [Colwellia sp. RSH04]RHW75309.1 RNA-binding S4 domain-containing protein [Colwellia sp. RSH04]